MRQMAMMACALACAVVISCDDSGTPMAVTGSGAGAAPDPAPVATYLPSGSPGAQVVGAQIGPAGGSIRLGDLEIVVPAGAVSKQTRFSIRVLPEAAQKKHAWAEFSPHNVQFAVPVIVRLPFSATDAEMGAPAGWWSGDAWIEQPTTVTADGRLQIEVLHFSVYATMRSRGITMIGG